MLVLGSKLQRLSVAQSKNQSLDNGPWPHPIWSPAGSLRIPSPLTQPSHTVLAGPHAHHALSFLWAFPLAGASAWNSRPPPPSTSCGTDEGGRGAWRSLSPPVALLMPLPCLCFVFSFHRSFHSMTHHTIYLLSLLSNIWIPSAGVSVLLADKPQAVGPMPDI